MAEVQLRGIAKAHAGRPVLSGVDLSAAAGDFLVVVGPSGCGKTTLLRLIAGLETPDAGEVRLGGRAVNDVPPRDRDVAMVFQSYALYPHMRVRDNLAFGLTLRRTPAHEIETRVTEAAGLLGLSALLERKPAQLSGGERQRVAMGRALVRRPKLFLFDEPLSNLDAALRVQMRGEIARLHQRLKTTMIYVTHDQVEAMTLATRLAVLNSGKLEQVGPPLELYHRPANRFVASFLGSPGMNFLPASRRDGSLSGPGFSWPCPAGLADSAREVLLGLRPQDMRVSPSGALQGRVSALERLGSDGYAYLASSAGPIAARFDPALPLAIGESIGVEADLTRLHVFTAEGRQALRHPER